LQLLAALIVQESVLEGMASDVVFSLQIELDMFDFSAISLASSYPSASRLANCAGISPFRDEY